jgi:hypothetical protein
MACTRCFVVPVAALLLAAAPLRAEDIGPVEQPPEQATPDAAPCMPCPCGPSLYFQADWLWTPHAGMWSDTRNFINGPDATGFENLPAGAMSDNGYRLAGGARLGPWIFEGIYSHYGEWNSSLNQNVNGVAFNAPGMAGNWAGQNFINGNTYFTPIFNAASQTAPVNTAGDQSGLGPSAAFPGDARPALLEYSHTEFYMTEANVKGGCYVCDFASGGLRLGLGYVNANLNNDSWVALTGTFRASNGGGATVSLPNSVLTSPTGGFLTLYSGGGGGFTDGVSNGGTGTPSQLKFTHQAVTRNDLNGGQVLLDFDLLQYSRFNLGIDLKAGLFDNFAQGAITETYSTTNNDLSAYARQFNASEHHLAFLGGAAINCRYHVTDEVDLCGGYEALFLTNQALGPEQILGLSNNWYRVQANGTAVIQTIHMGVQIAF